MLYVKEVAVDFRCADDFRRALAQDDPLVNARPDARGRRKRLCAAGVRVIMRTVAARSFRSCKATGRRF